MIDLTPYTVVAPSDSRLPNGGGYAIGTLYDVVPSKAGQIDNLATLTEKYGKQYQYFNGLDVTVSLRQGGLTLQGGTSTGQNVADACEVRDHLFEVNTAIGAGLVGSTVSTTSPYCHVAYGVLTQLRGLGSYVIPKIDAQVSAVFQSKPGQLLAANYAMPAALVAQALGRAPSGNVTNVTINLIEPGSLYGDRITPSGWAHPTLAASRDQETIIHAPLEELLHRRPIDGEVDQAIAQRGGTFAGAGVGRGSCAARRTRRRPCRGTPSRLGVSGRRRIPSREPWVVHCGTRRHTPICVLACRWCLNHHTGLSRGWLARALWRRRRRHAAPGS